MSLKNPTSFQCLWTLMLTLSQRQYPRSFIFKISTRRQTQIKSTEMKESTAWRRNSKQDARPKRTASTPRALPVSAPTSQSSAQQTAMIHALIFLLHGAHHNLLTSSMYYLMTLAFPTQHNQDKVHFHITGTHHKAQHTTGPLVSYPPFQSQT